MSLFLICQMLHIFYELRLPSYDPIYNKEDPTKEESTTMAPQMMGATD